MITIALRKRALSLVRLVLRICIPVVICQGGVSLITASYGREETLMIRFKGSILVIFKRN
jgi:hypothetical protein